MSEVETYRNETFDNLWSMTQRESENGSLLIKSSRSKKSGNSNPNHEDSSLPDNKGNTQIFKVH